MEDYFSFLKVKENIMLLLDGLTFGAGLFALWLFYRRNRSFEKQVDTGQKQAETAEKNLFNDRLSRGIEALGRRCSRRVCRQRRRGVYPARAGSHIHRIDTARA